jgi:hypothetical protein
MNSDAWDQTSLAQGGLSSASFDWLFSDNGSISLQHWYPANDRKHACLLAGHPGCGAAQPSVPSTLLCPHKQRAEPTVACAKLEGRVANSPTPDDSLETGNLDIDTFPCSHVPIGTLRTCFRSSTRA